MTKYCRTLLISLCFVACNRPPPPVAPPPPAAAAPSALPVSWSLQGFGLPGAEAPVSLDYLFYEPAQRRVWVPAGGTGSALVFDTAARTFARVAGFKTAERERHGTKRVIGPSSGTLGNGVAYIGNRASQEVCAVDTQTLALGQCLTLASPPDGVQFVASTREVWVTSPKTQSILVLDASQPGSLQPKATIPLPGEPEGYALDEARGLFFTNLEDRDSTLSIDLATRLVKGTWNPGCANDGPRGLALDSARGLLVVACTDHLQVLDVSHDGARLGALDTGPGVDNPAFTAENGFVFAAAGKAARLTVARLGEHGELSLVARVETVPGARNVVADANGLAYVADPEGARLLVLSPSRH